MVEGRLDWDSFLGAPRADFTSYFFGGAREDGVALVWGLKGFSESDGVIEDWAGLALLMSVEAAFALPFPFVASGWMFNALSVELGMSAMPIAMLPIVPTSAAAPPEIGSIGPSSRSYSQGRYLMDVRLHV